MKKMFQSRWHYAYQSILNETVRRRRKAWSWKHIREHRDTKNRYREAYIRKIENKKVPADLQKELDVRPLFSQVLILTALKTRFFTAKSACLGRTFVFWYVEHLSSFPKNWILLLKKCFFTVKSVWLGSTMEFWHVDIPQKHNPIDQL